MLNLPKQNSSPFEGSPEGRQYIPLAEAGRILGTSRDYLNVLVRRGKLRAVKLGRNWFTTSEWLSEYQSPASKLEQEEKAELAFLRDASLTERLQRVESRFENIQTFKDREISKKVSASVVSQEIQLPSRHLAPDEKTKILEAVKDRIKTADSNQFQNASKKLGISKSLKSWSGLKFSLVSGLGAAVLVVSLSIAAGLISIPNFNNQAFKYSRWAGSRLAGQANIFSSVFKNFPDDIPQFSDWLASGINKSISFFNPTSSELTIEELESGESKIAIEKESLSSINTLAQAEALDAPAFAEAPADAKAMAGMPEGKQTISISGSDFSLFENRLSLVESNLEGQSAFFNSELSLQKKTILGTLETLLGIAKLVPSHPISSIVVQGQPATLTTYSIQPQINTGFDRLSANYLNLSNNAEINGSLTVKSGGSFSSLSVSGATTLNTLSLASLTSTGDIVIGGTLAVTGTTTVNGLTVNGTLNVPNNSIFGNSSTTNATLTNFWSTNGTITALGSTNGTITNASTTYLTIGTNGWLNGNPIASTLSGTMGYTPYYASSGALLTPTSTIFISTANNVGIGTTSPSYKLDVAGIVNATSLYVNGSPYIGSQWTTNGTSIYYTAGSVGIGTTTPDVTALLDLTSTSTGLLPPRMTTAQKNSIVSPAGGLMLFDTDLTKLNVYNGSDWKNVGNPEIGGDVTGGTPGSVLYVDSSGFLGQDNANFFWNATGTRLFTTNASSTYGTISTLWSDLATISELNFTNATGTRLFATNGTITNASTTYLTVGNSFWGDSGIVSSSIKTPLIWNNGTLTASTTGANPIIFATNSSERMRIDENGNVGIGTTTPGSLLSVHSSGNVYFGGNLTVSGNSTFANLSTFANSSTTNATLTNFWSTNGTITNASTTYATLPTFWSTKGTITNASSTNLTATNLWSTTGNITTLTATNGTITNASTTYATLPTFWGTNGTITNASSTYLTVSNTAWINNLVAINATTTTFRASGLATFGGNVGIGTTSPSQKLDVVGNGHFSGALSASSTAYFPSLDVTGNGTITNASSTYSTSSDTSWFNNLVATNATTTTFRSSGLATFGGNVGVGTTTPSQKFSVQGDSYLYGNLTVTGTGGVGSNLTVTGQVFLADGTAAAPSLSFTSNANLGLFKAGTDILGFATSGSEKMRIDASGNVGIGTTTTSYAQLNIANNLAVLGTASSSFNGIVQFNGVPTGTDIDLGTIYLNPTSAGTNNVILGVAVSGTEKVRIDAEGDIQIVGLFNSTNPSGTNELFGGLTVRGNITLGTSTANTVAFTSRVNSNIVPSADLNYDLGTPQLRFNNIYAGNIIATTTTAAGTASSTFIINADNATDDTEDSSLQFSRGIASPNAILKWDSVNERFDFNAFPVNFQKNILVANTASSTFAGPVWFTGASQGTATSSAIVYINPSSGIANYNLFDIAVNGVERLRVDAEGDTVIWGSLGVENSVYDISQDTLTVDDSIQINGNAIKDSGGNSRITLGSTNAITGNLTATANFGAATSSITYPLSVQGNSYLYGDLTVTGNANLGSASTTNLTIVNNLWTGASSTVNFGGALLLSDGSAAAPSLAFTNDTDTGFYRIDTNRMSFVTNATDRLTLDANGNVGIGTTTPNDSLDVYKSQAGQTKIAVINPNTAGSASLNLGTNSTGEAGLTYYNSGYVTTLLRDSLEIATAGSSNILLRPGGYVGIGSMYGSLLNPQAMIDVGSNDAYNNTIVDEAIIRHNTTGTATNGLGAGLSFWGQAAEGTNQQLARIAGVVEQATTTAATFGSYLSFWTVGSGGIQEKMRLTSTGVLALATTTIPSGFGMNIATSTYIYGDLTASGNSAFKNSSTTNATLTNFWGTNGTITNASSTYLTGTNLWSTTGNITGLTATNGTITNASTTYATLPTFWGTNGTITNASTTYLSIGTNGWLNGNPLISNTTGSQTQLAAFSGTNTITPTSTIGLSMIAGLGTMATQNSNAVSISGGTITGITDLTVADGGTGASTLTGFVYGNGASAMTATTTPYFGNFFAGNGNITNASTTYLTVGSGAWFPGSGVWNSSGNVGIGTTTPLTKLDINGTTTLQNGVINSNIADSATGIGFLLSTNNTLSTQGSKLLSLKNASAEKFYIDKDGNLYTAGTILSGNGTGILMTNKSGGTVAKRSLVVIDTTTNSAFATTTTAYAKSSFGVITGVGLGVTYDADGDGVCDAEDVCMVAVGGEVEVLLTNASTAVKGEYIYTSATAGSGVSSAKQFDGLIGIVSNTAGSASGYGKMIFKVQPQVSGSQFLTKEDTALANGGYIEIAHNQSTNDVISNGWVYNTTTAKWEQIDNNTGPTGGTITYTDSDGLNASTTPYSDGYTVHTFTATGTSTLTFPSNFASSSIQVLVVAGGAGGGATGGGGGAGGYQYNASLAVTPQAYSVVVGGGGNGSTNVSVKGSNGSNSTFSTITATGGGGGGSNDIDTGNGANGGSGGGAASRGPAGSGGTGSQGYNGGNGYGSSPYPAGGGGGAGAAGGNGSGTVSGGGGIGIANSISGSSVTYAGGGSGSWRTSLGGTGTAPAAGGGGTGTGNTTTASAGTANTGGGGGGGGNDAGSGNGGNGGSGIVIIRYLTSSSGAYKIVQQDTNTVRMYNYSGSTQYVRLNVIPSGGGGSPGGGAGLYTNNNASVANGSYVEVAHNQNTADLVSNGWIYDTGQAKWIQIDKDSSTATGGTVTYSGGYTIHTFTSSGTFTVPTIFASTSVEYLVVAGGGGGGTGRGGGGGAGGFRTGTLAVTGGDKTVTVGGGGASATSGSNSVFSTITSTGGGKGGTLEANGTTGGSGGGGSGGDAGSTTGGAGNAGGYSPSEGNTGGAGVIANGRPAGGGGGAGAVGGDQPGTGNGGPGGAGTASSISGSSVTYAGGGGGGPGYDHVGGAGGSGGGGAGASSNNADGTAGTTNTGGGGGGAGTGGAAGAGGSGIVIIRYLSNSFSAFTITQQDANTVRLYNYSGSTQNLRLDVITGGLGRNSGTISLAPAAADTNATANTNSLWLNNTAAGGNLLKLQGSGTDLLTLSTAGVLYNSGNVGIGTTSPNNLLTLSSATTPSLGFTTSAGLSGWTMGIDTADANKFKIASSTAVGTNTRLTIDGSGNVGIGTTAPVGQLSFNMRGYVTPLKTWNTADLATIDYYADENSPYGRYLDISAIGNANGAVGGSNIRFITNPHTDASDVGIVRMVIDNAGNVGIGTTAPTSTLHIASPAAATAANGLSIGLAPLTEGLQMWYKATTGIAYIDNLYNGDGYATYFRMKTLGTPVNAMTILSSGNVGIGTTGPTNSLEVFKTGTGSLLMSIRNSDGGLNGRVGLGMESSAGGTLYVNTLPYAAVLGIDSARPLQLVTNNTVAMSILSNGNVGIGTTVPGYKLDVTGDINFTGKLREDGNEILASMIAPFAGACPTGWTEYTDARGRMVVGTPSGGTNAGTVGTALTNLANRTITDVPSHSHGIHNLGQGGGSLPNIRAYLESPTSASSAGYVAYTGVASVDVTMPYIQLTYCQKSAGADIAEWIPTSEDISKETIVSADPNNREKVIASRTEYDSTVIGIVATQPGWIMGDENKDSVQMALAGRVPVRVTLKNGEIKVGDPITTSSIKGVGMKATKAGSIVGKAMEAVNETSSLTPCVDSATGREEKCATALVFVNISWWEPSIASAGEVEAFQASVKYYEPLSLGNDFTSGDIVSLVYGYPLKQSSATETEKVGYLNKATNVSQVAGVISTEIGGSGELLRRVRSNNKIISELRIIESGKTEIKIAQSSSAINAGDPIALSSEAGLGAKAQNTGQIIGRAMEAWTPDSNKQAISVMVGLSWYDPYAYISSTGDFLISKNLLNGSGYQLTNIQSGEMFNRVGLFSDLLAANLTAGKIQTNLLATKELFVDGLDVKESLTNMIPYAIAGIKELASTTLALQNQINALIATSTLQAKVGTIDLAAIASDVNLDGHSLLNIGSISGLNGAWSIDTDGNIIAKSITAQAITATGPASGVTVYDRGTTQPKCVYVENDTIKISTGACGATQNLGTPVVIETASTPVAPVVATSTTEILPTATSTPEITIPALEPIATTTETVIVPETSTTTATTTP